MVSKFSIRQNRRRGQMFILATMLIAVYVVAISATVLNIGTDQITSNDDTLREPYNNVKRELQAFMEVILAKYTDNTTVYDFSDARTALESFLPIIEAVDTSNSVLTTLNLIADSFTIEAVITPNSNLSVGTVYSSAIQARFFLDMSTFYSTMKIIEEFTISYTGQVEIFANQIVIQQSRNSIQNFVSASQVYILNGSSPLYPTLYPNATGHYFCEGISSIDNVGILSVTFPNGVRVYS